MRLSGHRGPAALHVGCLVRGQERGELRVVSLVGYVDRCRADAGPDAVLRRTSGALEETIHHLFSVGFVKGDKLGRGLCVVCVEALLQETDQRFDVVELQPEPSVLLKLFDGIARANGEGQGRFEEQHGLRDGGGGDRSAQLVNHERDVELDPALGKLHAQKSQGWSVRVVKGRAVPARRYVELAMFGLGEDVVEPLHLSRVDRHAERNRAATTSHDRTHYERQDDVAREPSEVRSCRSTLDSGRLVGPPSLCSPFVGFPAHASNVPPMGSTPIRVVVFVAAIVVAVSAWAGFADDRHAFGLNLLAEGVATGIGLIVGLVIIDRIVEDDRRSRWQLVAVETESTLRFAVLRVALELYAALPAPRPGDADPLNMHNAGALPEGLGRLQELLRFWAGRTMNLQETEGLIFRMQSPMTRLRTDVTGRLLTLGQHPELVARLSDVEGAFDDVEFALARNRRLNLGPREVVERCADLVASLTEVIVLLGKTPLTEPPEAEPCPHGCRHRAWPLVGVPRNWPWAEECWVCGREL